MKKFISRILCAALLAGALLTAAGAADEIRVTVDGKPVEFTDAVPYVNSNNRTMIPLRAVADALGCDTRYQRRDHWNWDGMTLNFTDDNDFPLTGTPSGKQFDVVTVKKTVTYEEEIYEHIYKITEDRKLIFYPNHTYMPNVVRTPSPIVIEKIEITPTDSGYNGSSMGPNGFFLMDTPAVIKSGRTYLPIRYVAEYLGYDVAWDGASNTVIITSGVVPHIPEGCVSDIIGTDLDDAIFSGAIPPAWTQDEPYYDFCSKPYVYPANP